MEDNMHKKTELAAKIISVAFHPLLMPLYGMLIILMSPTLYGYLPFQVKKVLVFIITVNNVLVPLSLMPWFRYKNLISSYSMENRGERMFPLLSTSFFYSVTVYIFWRFHLPLFIKAFVLSAAILAIVVTILNFRWKISVHSVGAGALLSLITILSVRMQAPALLIIVLMTLVTGIIMSARLLLNAHRPAEVWTGFFTGAAVSAAVMLLAA
jgi:hypothetical protein